MSVDNATSTIRAAIRNADEQLIERHPWLGRDDAVAMAFFVGSVALICACVVAWTVGWLPTVVTIVLIALGISVLHEMEHDLIHDLYLSQPVVRTVVLTTIWFAKASLDPWKRGRLHLWHHKVSGQGEDVEERLIGMGMPWGIVRVLLTIFPPVGWVVMSGVRDAIRARVAEGARRPEMDPPMNRYRKPLNVLFLSLPIVSMVAWGLGAAWAWPVLVLWMLPNILRHVCIVLMSANSHYVDIPRGSLVEQNQILDHWMFWPFQFMCWNFGATHVVHHFFVRQAFWRRTLVFREVRQVMVDNGVRANDLVSFANANRRVA